MNSTGDSGIAFVVRICSEGELEEATYRDERQGSEVKKNWLPPRDSNPDSLLQRQVS
jgi:hypothetical protein